MSKRPPKSNLEAQADALLAAAEKAANKPAPKPAAGKPAPSKAVIGTAASFKSLSTKALSTKASSAKAPPGKAVAQPPSKMNLSSSPASAAARPGSLSTTMRGGVAQPAVTAEPESTAAPKSAPAAKVKSLDKTKSIADDAKSIDDLIDSVIEEAENDPSLLEDSELPDLPSVPRLEHAGETPAAVGLRPGQANQSRPAASALRPSGNLASVLGPAAAGQAPVLQESSLPTAHADHDDHASDESAEAETETDGDTGTDTDTDIDAHSAAPGKTNLVDMRPPSLRNVKTSSQMYAERQSRFTPTVAPTSNPRKVRGGVKLNSKEGPVSLAWSAQRWLRLVEDCAPNENLAEGLAYARLGQTKSLITSPGLISARVQGRLPFSYVTEIRLPLFTFQQWDQVLEAMVKEARPLAALLAGEVPQNIDDCFTQFRLHLFPAEPSHISLSCTCHRAAATIAAQARNAGQPGHIDQHPISSDEPAPSVPAPGAVPAPEPVPVSEIPAPALPPEQPAEVAAGGPLALNTYRVPTPIARPHSDSPWCKHICCVMALVAEKLSHDPFLIFQLRGLGKDDLLERLRQKRAVSTPGRQSTGLIESAGLDHPIPVYQPQIAGVTDAVGKPLDQSADVFWEAGPELDTIELPVEPPAVSHPLLRRLGTSPFQGAKFPLVGLLATCYETIGGKLLIPGLPTLPAALTTPPGSQLPGSSAAAPQLLPGGGLLT